MNRDNEKAWWKITKVKKDTNLVISFVRGEKSLMVGPYDRWCFCLVLISLQLYNFCCSWRSRVCWRSLITSFRAVVMSISLYLPPTTETDMMLPLLTRICTFTRLHLGLQPYQVNLLIQTTEHTLLDKIKAALRHLILTRKEQEEHLTVKEKLRVLV